MKPLTLVRGEQQINPKSKRSWEGKWYREQTR